MWRLALSKMSVIRVTRSSVIPVEVCGRTLFTGGARRHVPPGNAGLFFFFTSCNLSEHPVLMFRMEVHACL